MKKFIYMIMLAFAMVSCKPSEIGKMGMDRYIYFNPEDGYEYSYSFLYAKGKEEIDIVIPLKYAGRPYDSDMEYKIVSGKGSTAVEGKDYRLPEKTLFKGASFEDEIVVTILKPDNDEVVLELVLQLADNENFRSNMKDADRYKIVFTNKIYKPSWWDEIVTRDYLGKYSDKKLELFVINIYDGDFGELSSEDKLNLAKVFGQWLDAHPDQAVDNGEIITVPV